MWTSAREIARRIHAIADRSQTHSSGVRALGPLPPSVVSEEDDAARVLLGDSIPMQRVRSAIRRVSRFRDVPVLVEGPTGTGKELVAKAIHALSAPAAPLVTINCAAIPAELFESELFGHDAGAFTSARAARLGLMEEAADGVLFLDEVGELPLPLQAKLLRVLETREFRRVGSTRTRSFRARIVSATNRCLGDTACDVFRADLYFRIAGHTIRTPALREHPTDIAPLVEHFARTFCSAHRTPVARFTDDAMELLRTYAWPGNVRQLRAVVHNAVIVAQAGVIGRPQLEGLLPDGQQLKGPRSVAPGNQQSLPDLEREIIQAAYRDNGENLTRAAETLGIPRTTLRDRLKRYGLR